MKIVFNVLLLSIALFHLSCDDNPNTAPTNGQLYLNVTLYNPYFDPESSHAGVTANLLDEDVVIQTVQSDEKGDCVFKGVPAGVYGIQVFKQGYAYRYSTIRTDTFVNRNIQFVGAGKYNTNITHQFVSINNPDTSFWMVNPTLQYEFIRTVKPMKVFVKRIKKKDDPNHPDGYSYDYFNDGTIETNYVKVNMGAVNDFPFKNIYRKVKVYTKFDDNEPTWTEYDMSTSKEILHRIENRNIIVRDSIGQLLTKENNFMTYSTFDQKRVSVWAECEIMKSKFDNSPKRFSKTEITYIDLY